MDSASPLKPHAEVLQLRREDASRRFSEHYAAMVTGYLQLLAECRLLGEEIAAFNRQAPAALRLDEAVIDKAS